MRSLISALAGVLLVFTSSTSVIAGGDAWQREPPPARPTCGVGLFQGSYVGVGTGYAQLGSTVTNTRTGAKVDADGGGYLVGVYGGYNLQCGRWVAGIETDLFYVDSESTAGAAGQRFSSQSDFSGSTRLRAGIAAGPVLFYGSVGVGYGSVENRLISPALGFDVTHNDTRIGLVAGLGAEFALTPTLALRVEGSWMDLGETKRTYTVVAGNCGSVCTSTQKWQDEQITARVGLAYKFGYRPPYVEEPIPYPPLK